jgi:conjugative relaxase-like TrwC/TraI family protein
MITISPIFEKDGDKAYREFFQDEFVAQRLGNRGYWQGEAAKILQLGNPVQLAAFQNLLHGRTPDGGQRLVPESGGSDRELGWQLTISTSPSLSVLWALAPARTRLRLEYTHFSDIRGI